MKKIADALLGLALFFLIAISLALAISLIILAFWSLGLILSGFLFFLGQPMPDLMTTGLNITIGLIVCLIITQLVRMLRKKITG